MVNSRQTLVVIVEINHNDCLRVNSISVTAIFYVISVENLEGCRLIQILFLIITCEFN